MFLQHRASDLALVLSMCVALFDCSLNPQLYKSRKTGSKIRRRGAAFIDYVFKDSTDIEIIAFSSSCGKLGSANSASGRSVGLLRAGGLLCYSNGRADVSTAKPQPNGSGGQSFLGS
jgi:hypothetical protein